MKVYVLFFSDLCRKFQLEECNPKGKSPCPSIDVFSTNYDNVIELYGRKNGTSVCDGYRYIGPHHVFDSDIFDSARDQVRLYKLHGTVTYARLEDDSISRITYFPKQGSLPIDGAVAFPDLIYPGIHTCVAREPQLELLHRLKRSLLAARVCIVLGYSFGDPHIRQIFLDSCDRNSALKVLSFVGTFDCVQKLRWFSVSFACKP